MTIVQTSLKDAALVDFTGAIGGFQQFSGCDDRFVQLVRSEKRPGAIVVIDRAVGMPVSTPCLVADHLNLTGTSPLLGPNHPGGDRFPVIQDIYVTDVLAQLPRVIVAGLKSGVSLSPEDINVLKSLDADTCCYNLVPAMLLAAHVRCRVLGILVSETGLPAEIVDEIKALVGGSK